MAPVTNRVEALRDAFEAALRVDLDARRDAGLYRRRRIVESAQAPEIEVDGRPLLAFCSNDYLGLAADPRIAETLRAASTCYGTGSGAAHLVSGHSAAHQGLEQDLAEFTGRARALLFSTGYMANLGVITALLDRGDAVFEDRLNHASLIDAGLLSRARRRRYAHADVGALRRQLGAVAGRKLVVSDGVFSMDGDVAPLRELADACREHAAWLLVDDAHGLGVLGPDGRGSIAQAGLDADAVPVLVGTLGKAFGTFGAFVAGSDILIETLIQRARSYIYTTAPPPALAEATRESLRIARAEDWRRRHLHALVEYFRAGAAALELPLGNSSTPIQPLLLGSSERALQWSAGLEAAGILVSAIRPPTVPAGSARLRISLTVRHSMQQVDRLLAALAELARAEQAA